MAPVLNIRKRFLGGIIKKVGIENIILLVQNDGKKDRGEKKTPNLPTEFEEIDGGARFRRNKKNQILLIVTKDRKLRRSMIAYNL